MNQKYNIYLRKDGRYEGRIPIGRKPDGRLRYRSIYHHDKKKLKLIMEAEAQKEINVNETKTSKLKFSALFDQWLLSKRGKVKESTFAIYRCHIEAHLRPLLGDKYITSMTTEKLNDYCNTALTSRMDGNGKLSSKSQIDILRTLNNVLRYGMNKGLIHYHLQCEYPKAEPKKMNVLREKEQTALEAVLRNNIDKNDALGIYLCLYTGLRVGELCGLKWEDIDFDHEIIYVQRTVQRIGVDGEKSGTKILIGEPKSSKSKREIPIPDHLIDILKRRKENQSENFFLSNSPQCYEPRRIQAAFHRYLDLAGLSHRGIHCTRHTFATRWVELGVDVKTLSEILGHTNIRITLDKYVHISEKVKRKNINKIQPLHPLDIGHYSRQNLIPTPPYTANLKSNFFNAQT